MSVDIGKISVTFAASTQGFTRGVASATSALLDFAKKSRSVGDSLKGSFSAGFGDSIDAISRKLNDGALSSAAYGEAISAAFGRASKAIDSGGAGSFDVLAKQMEVGVATGEDFAEVLSDVSSRAESAIDSAASESVAALSASMDEGRLTAKDFADSITSIAAGQAGAGLENTRNAVVALDAALSAGAVTGSEFLQFQRDVSNNAMETALRRQSSAVAEIREQFDDGAIESDAFVASLRTIETSFRIGAIAEYESQMESVARAHRAGTIATEEFEAEQQRLAAVLSRRVVGQLEEQLAELPAAYAAAGASAEALAEAQQAVNEQIEAGNRAVARAVDRQTAGDGAGAAAGRPGVMGGLERAGAVASLIPGDIGRIGGIMERIVGASEAAEAAIGALGPRFAALAGPVGLAAGGLLVVGGALMYVVSQFGEAAREAQKLSTLFGTTMRETAELQTVLGEVGSSVGEFQKVSRSLRLALETAADGAGKSGVAFRRLGLDAKELRFEDAATQARAVIVALAGIENPAERSMLAVKLLGKSGAEFAAKFGTDIKGIEERFLNAAQAVEKFKTAFSDFDSQQLMKAKESIDNIGGASEGMGKAVAAAFAPLMGGIGAGLAETIGAITNVMTPFIGIFQVAGALVGGVFQAMGAAFNTLARIFSAGLSIIGAPLEAFFRYMTGGIGVVELFQGTVAMLVADMNGLASDIEWVRDTFAAWTTGTTVEEIKAAQEEMKKMAELGEAAAKIQEKYGDRTEEIKAKIKEVAELRNTMGDDGKPLISAVEARSALDDLNKQLKEASPHLKLMNSETDKFQSAMKSANKAAADMGNNIAANGFAEYKKGYEELLAKLRSGKIGEDAFGKGIEGLAEKFNKEMERAKPIKALQDQIEQLSKKFNEKQGGAALAEDFQKFDQAQRAGGVSFKQKSEARLQRMDEVGAGLGLNVKPKLEGLDLFNERMAEIDRMAAEVAKGQGMIAEEEKKLHELRKAAIKDLLSDAKKIAGTIGERQKGPAEKALEDSNTLEKAYQTANKAREAAIKSGDQNGVNEANRQMNDIKERQGRVTAGIAGQNKYEGSGEKSVREFDAAMADIERSRASLQWSPENAGKFNALNESERNLKEKFRMENIDLIDKTITGGKADKRAASGIDATSQEGVSTYFRIMREDGSVTKRQLEEARQSRMLLRKIADNTQNQVPAAGI